MVCFLFYFEHFCFVSLLHLLFSPSVITSVIQSSLNLYTFSCMHVHCCSWNLLVLGVWVLMVSLPSPTFYLFILKSFQISFARPNKVLPLGYHSTKQTWSFHQAVSLRKSAHAQTKEAYSNTSSCFLLPLHCFARLKFDLPGGATEDGTAYYSVLHTAAKPGLASWSHHNLSSVLVSVITKWLLILHTHVDE